MADTMIGPEMCPACGRVVWLVRLMSGAHYAHVGGRAWSCLGETFVREDEAEAVRRIRERDRRLTVRAHP
jgi:hypothetical protein